MKLHDRLIKADFWTDSWVMSLPPLQRLFYQGLWAIAEDSGCLEDDIRAFKALIFPGEENLTLKTLESWKQEFLEAGKLIPYQDERKQYFYIANFHKYQKLRNAITPKLPMPNFLDFEPFESNDRQGTYTTSL